MQGFIIVGYVWQILGSTLAILPPLHPWAVLKKPIRDRVNVIHLLYVVKCFLPNVIILITTKNCMNFIVFFYFFSMIFISSWRLYHFVLFIAKLWDDKPILFMGFLLLNFCNFRYLSLLKGFFIFEKSYSFCFYKYRGGFGWNSPQLFFGKNLCLHLCSILYISYFNTLNIFKISWDIP